MKNIAVKICAVLILLSIGGVVYAETTGVTTNVYFCKMTKAGDTYELEPLATQYTGENSYGRMTFVSVSDKLETGDYAIVQDTSDGIKLIQSLSIETSGEPAPEYTMLNIELMKSDLPETLKISTDAGAAQTTTLITPAPASTAVSAPVASSPATAVPATTKSPVGPLTVLSSLGICGIAYLSRRRM